MSAEDRSPILNLALNLARSFAPNPHAASLNSLPPAVGRKWYAVFTLPQNEKAVARYLQLRDIESFLPTFETVRVWKNRQHVRTVLPLFPTYLFIRIDPRERIKVLQSPGVLHIVGNGREMLPLPDAEVDFLRSGLHGKKIEPYRELVVGEKVRVQSGPMRGMKGMLVRKNGSLRFVLALDLIHQFAAIEVDAHDLAPTAD